MTDIRSCEDAIRLLAQHLDGELDPAVDRQLERHLDTCRNCYSRAEFERRLKAQVAELANEPVRPQLAARVRTLIRDFAVHRAD